MTLTNHKELVRQATMLAEIAEENQFYETHRVVTELLAALVVLRGDLDKLREALRQEFLAAHQANCHPDWPHEGECFYDPPSALALLSLPDEQGQTQEHGGRQKPPVSKATGANESEGR